MKTSSAQTTLQNFLSKTTETDCDKKKAKKPPNIRFTVEKKDGRLCSCWNEKIFETGESLYLSTGTETR